MVKASKIVHSHGLDFVLGTVRSWDTKHRRDKRSSSDMEYIQANMPGTKLSALFAFEKGNAPESNLYSLTKLICQFVENAFIMLDLPHDDDPNLKQYWYVLIIEGDLQSGSDVLLPLTNEEQEKDLRNRLSDVKQVMEPGNISRFSSVDELLSKLLHGSGLQEFSSEHLTNAAVSLKKRRFKVSARQAVYGSLLVVAISAFGYQQFFTGIDKPQEKEIARVNNLQSLLDSSLNEYKRSIPASDFIGFFKGVHKRLPTDVHGFGLASVSCSYYQCTVSYTANTAWSMSDAFRWAKTVDPASTYDSSSKTITLVITGSQSDSPHFTSDFAPEDASIRIADSALALHRLGISVSFSELSPAPGARELNNGFMTGTWDYSNVSFKFLLAAAEGLIKLPNVGVTYVNVVGGSASFGGIYAVK